MMSRLILLLSLFTAPCHAQDRMALEARELRLASELRCVVCQNQTVAESNAPLAADMRREIHEQLKSGSSDQQVIDFFEQRYGAFVHYRPPFKPATWLLWGAPIAFGVGGLLLLFSVLRRHDRTNEARPLTTAQRAQARRWLDHDTTP